jgi:hypothetical protein
MEGALLRKERGPSVMSAAFPQLSALALTQLEAHFRYRNISGKIPRQTMNKEDFSFGNRSDAVERLRPAYGVPR